MSNLGKYIVKGLVGGVVGIAIGEVIVTVPAVVKKYKEAKKAVKKDEKVDVLPIISEAAKERVESIKKDPMAEVSAIWGVVCYLIGRWTGFWKGTEYGWNLSKDITNNLVNIFKDRAPKEFNSMLDVLKKQHVYVLLKEWVHNDQYFREIWDASKCEPAKVKEV